jgi:DinB superfamily
METVFIGLSHKKMSATPGIRKTAASARAQTSHSYSAFLSSHEGEAMSDPRFPIGNFQYEGTPSADQRAKFIAEIEQTPAAIRAAIQGLSPKQLDTPYREGGWNVRQVVHHVPESHMNAYIRFKLALTEDEPTIKPYAEDRWAKLADVQSAPTEVSLALLENLHVRWVVLLRGLRDEDWKRTFIHPESGVVSLEKNLAIYAWHGKHHTAHITELRKRMHW